MKDQEELGARVAGLLAESTQRLTPEQRDRLGAARRLALARHRELTAEAPAHVPAWAGSVSRFTEQRVFGIRYVVPFAVLILGLVGVVYMHTGAGSSEIADIDAGILTDELPINAFLDQSLDSWLKRPGR